MSETFDHRRLSNPRFAGQDRIVLAAAHQHVDDLANFLLAAQHRIDFAGGRLGGQILGKPIERGGALRGRRRLRGRRSGGNQARSVDGLQILFFRAGPDFPVLVTQSLDRDLGELARNAGEGAGQLARLQRSDKQMAGPDLRLTEEKRGVVPSAIQQVHDRVGDLRHFRLVLTERGNDLVDVIQQLGAIELEMVGGGADVGPVVLQDMGQPVGKFHIAIARSLGLAKRFQECVVADPIELARNRFEADVSHERGLPSEIWPNATA